MPESSRKGVLFVLLSAVGYSLLPTFVKHIEAMGMTPLDIAAWRFAFAMPVLWLLVILRRRTPPANPLPRRRIMGLGVLMAAAALTAFFGLERLPSSTMVVLFYTYPTMVAIISLFLGERLSTRAWLALGMTLIGIALTVPEFSAGLGESNLIGVGFAFLNALLVAVYFILNNRVLKGHSALLRASAWLVTGSFTTMMVVSLLRRELAVPAQPELWLFLLALSTVSTIMPIFCMTLGIQALGASRAAIIGTVEPVLTVTIAALVLGERMQPVQIVGALFILVSVILLQVRLNFKRNRQASVAAQ
ncbi:MAG: DMT family transporter [Anaerolineae bacterium]|nr:DMT family transporter [Anaerolineae bacterium]